MRAPSLALIIGLPLSLSFLVGCENKENASKDGAADAKASTPASKPASVPSKKDAKAANANAKAPVVKAHQAAFKTSAAPAGAWKIDGDKTDVSFTIVSKSAGPVTGHFPKGTQGFLKDGKGEVTIDLTKLVTTDKTGAENAVRDARVVHAFFGVPLASAPKDKMEASKAAMASQEKVDAAWKKLNGVLPTGVTTAAYRISGVEGLDKLEEGKASDIMLHGTLILWDSLETHFVLSLQATKIGKSIAAHSKGLATLHLEKLLGKTTRNLVFETMLAAGCGHQAGIHSEVMINIEKLSMTQD
ncbi:MAG: YceI family protein [Deltaproteobacteria bacterium]|nr:YceI family protein [Deltaproteobacteria bacterium]